MYVPSMDQDPLCPTELELCLVPTSSRSPPFALSFSSFRDAAQVPRYYPVLVLAPTLIGVATKVHSPGPQGCRDAVVQGDRGAHGSACTVYLGTVDSILNSAPRLPHSCAFRHSHTRYYFFCTYLVLLSPTRGPQPSTLRTTYSSTYSRSRAKMGYCGQSIGHGTWVADPFDCPPSDRPNTYTYLPIPQRLLPSESSLPWISKHQSSSKIYI